MANNPVGWFEIYVQDMNRARAFYESVFSIRLEQLEGPDVEMWAFAFVPERPGAPGALVKMAGFPSGGNSTLVYFTCSDCAAEAQRAAASGGEIFKDKFPIGQHGFIALVTDTEGNMIGLHSLQ
jgi:predicted enzyme related to lactoylglutathione lyase